MELCVSLETFCLLQTAAFQYWCVQDSTLLVRSLLVQYTGGVEPLAHGPGLVTGIILSGL